jgi:hypothetical protein
MLTTDDVKKIIGSIKVAYPNYKPDDLQLCVDMYKALFKDYTYEQVSMGLHRFIMTDKSGFAPSIGQIIDCMLTNSKPDEMSEMEIWGLVSRAIRNAAYHSEDEFNKLPELAQKAIGSSQQLNIWAVDEGYNESLSQSNFLRSYRIVKQRSEEDAKLPQYIKDYAITQNNVKELEDKNGFNT